MSNYSFIWPEVFINKDFSYNEKGPLEKRRALANGLEGWGICMSGEHPVENFGIGMVKIGALLGENATADNLMRVAREYQARTRTL